MAWICIFFESSVRTRSSEQMNEQNGVWPCFFLSASTTIQWTWTEWSVWPKTSKSMLWNEYVHRKLQTHLVTLRLRERKVKAIKLHLFYDQFVVVVVFFSLVINVNSDLEMPLQWLYQWHSNAHAHSVWLVCYLCVIWLWISDNGMRSTQKKTNYFKKIYKLHRFNKNHKWNKE